jgi:uncharacterized membrane protein (UPF0127 family)
MKLDWQDKRGEAMSRGRLSLVYMRLGELEKAEAHAHRAREITEGLGLIRGCYVRTFTAYPGKPGRALRRYIKTVHIPPGMLKIMTDFLPPAALEAQPCRLTGLDAPEGFPWTQYGAVPATVASVASEVRDGWVRVELAVRPDAAPPIPLQHGLPGTVEVEVEHVSPATLVLRTAGLLLTGPGTSRGFWHAADLPRTTVEVRRPETGVVLLVVDAELATTAESRTRGLMGRATLPANRGMLFLFESAQPLSFWMFNTLIPLDMIFADAQRRITTIHAAVPPCQPPKPCPSYASDGVAQFILEVNAGTAAQAGIAIGDELRWSLQ